MALTSPGLLSPAEEESFNSFRGWTARFDEREGREGGSLTEAEKEMLAVRAEGMKLLLRDDPEEALRRAVSFAEWERLPDEVRARVEEPFSIRAALDVFPLCGAEGEHEGDPAFGSPDHDPAQVRQGFRAELTDERGRLLDTYLFGRRGDPYSRSGIPVQGVRLDGVVAIREETFTRIPDSERELVSSRYARGATGLDRDFLSGEKVGPGALLALAGGRVYAFRDEASLEQSNEYASRLEELIGPDLGSRLLLEEREAHGTGPIDGEHLVGESADTAKITSNTTRSAIVILVDFSDKTGTPINPSTLQARFDGEVHDQVASMSYHKTGIDATVISQVFRMPKPTTYYNGTDDGSKKNGALFNDAIAAAQAGGVTTSGYNHRCIIFKGIGMGYCGLATVGGSKVWLPCHGSKVIVHELGHNFGLGHASFWTVTGSDPIDPAGSSQEYGDNTSIMGGGGVTSGHFHAQGKRKLNWLESSQVHFVGTTSSTQELRIYRFDHEDTDPANAKRAVRVTKGSNEYYWIGYRQRFGGSNYQHYLKGVQLHWQQPNKSKSWLIDVTAGGGKNNSGLPLGRTYTDPAAQVHITPLRRGGSGVDQWIDVQVNVGGFAGNSAPSGSLRLPRRLPVSTPVSFGASAEDPDGDDLAYYFDIGTGAVVGNDGTASGRSLTWSSKQTVNVKVTVSDRKGGGFSDAGSVQVQDFLALPAAVAASDGAHSDRVAVSWNPVTNASQYVVYRSATGSVFQAEELGTVNAPSTSFDDFGATPGQEARYFVQALGSGSASTLGNGDPGLRAEGPPPAPTITSVSSGTYSDRIVVFWSESDTASSYEVLRSTEDDVGTATLLAEVAATDYSDTGAPAGVTVYYWVRAKNGAGTALGNSSSGYRRFPAPGALTATRGEHGERVLVSWEGLTNATHYEIYGSSEAGGLYLLLGTSDQASFSHESLGPLEETWYKVRAAGAIGDPGDFAGPVSGFRTFRAPPNLEGTERFYDDRVLLTWDSVESAPGVDSIYEIWRAPAGEGLDAAERIGTTTDRRFEDFSAVPGVEYRYWIRAVDPDGAWQGAFSDFRSGIRSDVPPFQPDQKSGISLARLLGNDLYNLTGAGQTAKVRIRKKSARAWIQVENDGIFEDAVTMVASRGDASFSLGIRETFGGRNEVSGAASTGRYRTDTIEESGARSWQVTIRAKGRALARSTKKSYFFWAVSARDPDHQDRSKIQVQTKVKKRG